MSAVPAPASTAKITSSAIVTHYGDRALRFCKLRRSRASAIITAMSQPSTTTAELACVDGRITPADEATIPATDEGLLRGDGAFEVIRIYDGRPVRAQRPPRPARALGGEPAPAGRTSAPSSRSRSRSCSPSAAAASSTAACASCSRAAGSRLLLTEPLPPTPERIRLGVVEYAPTRVLDGVKSLSYGANMLCGRLARERGFDEALLVTPHGRVLEAPTSSLFWADSSGTLLTPPLSEHILASITRARVLDLVAVEERPCTMDDLRSASEAFLASTTREVQSIAADRGHRAARRARARARHRRRSAARVEDELAAGA